MQIAVHKRALKGLAILLLIVSFYGNAQIKDTVNLNEVVIKASRLKNSFIGKKVQSFDSVAFVLFKNQTLDMILSNNSTVYVKDYGSGASKTTTFRGGNASHTAILWNGLNIQNSMLGQTDLSNVAVNLFNAIDVEYGGSSTLWGSGAMGGAIHLNNKHSLNKGTSASLSNMLSTIGMRSAATDVSYSNSKLSFNLKGMFSDCDNHYSFYKDSATIMKQTKASYTQLSAMPELKWYINRNNNIQASVWLNKGLRNIPNYLNSFNNKVQQADESQRANLNWEHSKNKIVNHLRSAYFFETLNYSDSLANIRSNATLETRIIEDDIYLKWQPDHVLNIGFNYTKNEARSNNFIGTKFIEKYAIILANKDVFFHGRLTTNVAGRYEHTSTGLDPFTYNIGANYNLYKNISLKINAGKVYRIPTLNDMYWTPGGNVNLKPEDGFIADGTAEYVLGIKNFNVIINGSAFYKLIDNWIQWVPGNGGISNPVNLQQVFTRGTETSWHLSYSKNKFKVQLKCLSSYVLSTVNKTNLEGDATLNKQLIYTPRYTINSSFILCYNNFAVSYFHNYVGYRFTASDNSAWIKPYHYSTVRTSLSYPYKALHLGVFANINNVLNVNYMVINNYPQPLRFFEFGIQLNYKQKNK